MLVPMVTGGRAIGVISLVSAESRRNFSQADLQLAEELGRRAGHRGRARAALPRALAHRRHAPARPAARRAPARSPACGSRASTGRRARRTSSAATSTTRSRPEAAGCSSSATSPAAAPRPPRRPARRATRCAPPGGCSAIRSGALAAAQPGARPSAASSPRARPRSSMSAARPRRSCAPGIRSRCSSAPGRCGPSGTSARCSAPGPTAAGGPSRWRSSRGDVLVLYTDGVTDTRGADGRFGDARLLATLRGVQDAPGAVAAIDRALNAFQVGAQADDTAVLALDLPLDGLDLSSADGEDCRFEGFQEDRGGQDERSGRLTVGLFAVAAVAVGPAGGARAGRGVVDPCTASPSCGERGDQGGSSSARSRSIRAACGPISRARARPRARPAARRSSRCPRRTAATSASPCRRRSIMEPGARRQAPGDQDLLAASASTIRARRRGRQHAARLPRLGPLGLAAPGTSTRTTTSTTASTSATSPRTSPTPATTFVEQGPEGESDPLGVGIKSSDAAAPGDEVKLRTYRLALVTDPSYATYFGGSANVTAAKVTLMNRVDQIYEDETAIRMVLIADNDKLNLDTAAQMTGANGPCGAAACYTASQASDLRLEHAQPQPDRPRPAGRRRQLRHRPHHARRRRRRRRRPRRRRRQQQGAGLHRPADARSATSWPSTTWRTRWATSSTATTPSTARSPTARPATATRAPRSSRARAPRSWPTPASAAPTTSSRTRTRTGRSAASTRSRRSPPARARTSARSRPRRCATSTAPTRSRSASSARPIGPFVRGTNYTAADHPARAARHERGADRPAHRL